MRVLRCAQRTPEWYAARLGRLTSSCASEAFATIKKGESAARRNLRVRLVLERLTGKSQESDFQSFDMTRGIELEPEARDAYEAETGTVIESVGCVQHDTLMAACSPGRADRRRLDRNQSAESGDASRLRARRAARRIPDADHAFAVDHRPGVGGFRLLRSRLSAASAAEGDAALCEADIDFAAYELSVRLFLSEVERELEALSGVAVA
jgi:hypothetical protein